MEIDLLELEQVLRCHATRYPRMEPVDAVKLIYQNEFGGGHLVRDESAFWRYLQAEYESVAKDAAATKYEALGNGILRVHLAALREEELLPLKEAFLRSAETHRGNLQSFLKKLACLEVLCREGIFAFGTEELAAYLREYAAAGYPMVSHSGQFRSAYKPAYRIISQAHGLPE